MAKSSSFYFDLIRDLVTSKELKPSLVLEFLFKVLDKYRTTSVSKKEAEPSEFPKNQNEEFQTSEEERFKMEEENIKKEFEDFSEPFLNNTENSTESSTVVFEDDCITECYNWPIKSEADNENEEKEELICSDSDSGSNRDKSEVEKSVKEQTEREVIKNENSSETVEAELEKLLKQASTDPIANKKLLSDEGEENTKAESFVKDKNCDNKSKEEESLLNFFDQNEEVVEESTEKSENFEQEEDYEAFLNKEVKSIFLLTSNDEDESDDDNVEKEIVEKKKKTEKKSTESKRKEKRKGDDDLEKYRIPNINLDKKQKQKDEDQYESITLDSSDSEEIKAHCSNKKSQNQVHYPESDSSSDIQQIFFQNKASPSKGRKNIKKIWNKKKLLEETTQAAKKESERKKRLREREKLYNQFFPDRDSQKLILDFDPKTGKELVVVHEKLALRLKPHQREGVKFMWDNCFESSSRVKEGKGSGCILAHCMGLGKTLQVITLIHTLLRYDLGIKTIVVMCPLNTVHNWMREFEYWLKNLPNEIHPKCVPKKGRAGEISDWMNRGGVLIIGYDRFRALLKQKEDKGKISESFLDPGPDLVVCDEGHLLKNEKSFLSRCLSLIKTPRRIVLTGTPMQNNLLEYYCMVQFVKPNLLGSKKEFSNRFMNPINNGQFEDSTEADVRLMKRRAHVLHTMVEGFVQRFSYGVLTPFLPEKQEYVISISLTETQISAYRDLIDSSEISCKSLFKYSSWMHKIWTHPLLMLSHCEKETDTPEMKKVYWKKYIREEEIEACRSGGKILLLFQILEKCKEIGDKVLVFSQYLESLDLIQFFLKKAHRAYMNCGSFEYPDRWENGEDYFRMDGSTSGDNRSAFCSQFNDPKNQRSRLFLISTKAGGLGINLVAANRVIVFDASWNPSHDLQSIFRVYRFGQKKNCYIYRFLASATLEEKIYRRQVTKLSLAHRILDEHQIERHYSSGNLQELFKFEPIPRSEWKKPKIPKDELFADVLARNFDVIVGYHEHDSLLENKEEEELTEEERKAAWEEYEKEKLVTRPLLPENLLQENPNQLGMKILNYEALKTVNTYKTGIVSNTTECNGGLVYNNARESPLCKIVDVRTLKDLPQDTGDKNIVRVVDVGNSIGMLPLSGETYDDYYQRITSFLNNKSPHGSQTNGAAGGSRG